MRRDLHVVEQFCYLEGQELVKDQAPQLEAVSPHERHLIEKLTNVIEVTARELLEKL